MICDGRGFQRVGQGKMSSNVDRRGERIWEERSQKAGKTGGPGLGMPSCSSCASLLQPFERHQSQTFEKYVSNTIGADRFIESDIMFFMTIKRAWLSEEWVCYQSFSKLIYGTIPFYKRNHSLISRVCNALKTALMFFLYSTFSYTFPCLLFSPPI